MRGGFVAVLDLFSGVDLGVGVGPAPPPFCGLLNISALHVHFLMSVNMESRHLPNLSIQNALDCIPENFKNKIEPKQISAPRGSPSLFPNLFISSAFQFDLFTLHLLA